MPATPMSLADLRLPHHQLALFLDVDGTLLEIADRPQDVSVPADLPPLLVRLAEGLGGALALVSGRALADLDHLFAPLRLPAGGQHGLEMRDAKGDVSRTDTRSAELGDIEATLETFVAEAPGTLLERKGMTVALHFRNAPEREDGARAMADALMARHGERFQIQDGKMVLEFKPRGTDKGTVIERFMAAAPFAGRMPVFIGDDATDEHGFAVVNRLGGVSIQVGDRTPTAAAYRTSTTETLKIWLSTLAKVLESGPQPTG